MTRISDRWRTALICALLSAATLAVFWPVLHSDFIRFDDPQYVLENPHVTTGLTWDNVKWSFQSGYASNWHPVTWISHMVDVQCFGLAPGGHHFVNLLLHIANTVLLFLLLQRLTGATWSSAFVAALFALHPLHVESVAWVSERKDVLSTFFFLTTVGAYARYAKSTAGPAKSPNRRWLWYGLALGLFALGLMSKPMLVTLPFVLLLLDIWPLRRFGFPPESRKFKTLLPFVAEKIPFFVLCVVSSLLTYSAQSHGHSVTSTTQLTPGPRIANAISSYWKYLDKTILPTKLSIFYPHPAIQFNSPDKWNGFQVALGALLLVAVSVYAFSRWKRAPWFATGWFWYLGALVPVIGFIQVGGQGMADRYTYIPLIGIFLGCSWMAVEALKDWRHGKAVLAAVGVLIVAACAMLTRAQVGYWRSNTTLFEHALAVSPNNPVAHCNLGEELGEHGKYEPAMKHFQAAIDADPHLPDGHFGMAITLSHLGQLEKAVQEYQIVLSLKPTAEACNGLGVVLSQLGKREEAKEQLTRALLLNRDYAEAHHNLGVMLSAEGKYAEAATHFAEAVRLKPNDPEELIRLAGALVAQGKPAEAEGRLTVVTRRWPTNAVAFTLLGDVQRLQGKQKEAANQYTESLRLRPGQVELEDTLGRMLIEQNSFAAAETHFTHVVELNPDHVPALENLGRVLASQGKFAAAQTRFREVVRLKPTDTAAQIELGKVLMILAQTNDATACFATALRLNPALFDENVQSGKSLADQGQLDAAVGKLTVALWLKPDDATVNSDLGMLLARQGKFDAAIDHFEQSLRLQPTAEAHYNIGLAQMMQGKIKETVAHYKEAIRLKPDWTSALNNLAWVLATHPGADVRDGPEAVRLAERACQLTDGKEARYLGTLDAAYAEAGRFSDAISTAEKARALALAAGQNDIAQAAERRLDLYRRQQPYRQ